MKSQPQSGTLIEFGPFGFDRALGKLSKHGTPVRLRGMPLKILQHLVERPAEVVIRRRIAEPAVERHRFWGFRAGS
jgi:DNA-binding winged helix-turn-helix (wHTH) protein